MHWRRKREPQGVCLLLRDGREVPVDRVVYIGRQRWWCRCPGRGRRRAHVARLHTWRPVLSSPELYAQLIAVTVGTMPPGAAIRSPLPPLGHSPA